MCVCEESDDGAVVDKDREGSAPRDGPIEGGLDMRGDEDAGDDQTAKQDECEAMRFFYLRADPVDALLGALLGALDKGTASKEEVEV